MNAPTLLAPIPVWHADAACRDLADDTMFPHPNDRAAVALAQSYCARCPVEVECGGWADARNELHGYWGGRYRTGRTRDRRAERRNGGPR